MRGPARPRETDCMNVVLWILQVLLGIFFVFMLRPNPARLQSGMKYVIEMRSELRIFAGVAGIALVATPFLGPLKVLAPLAAAGLVVLMRGAIVFHLGRREHPNIGLNAVLAALAAVIA
ncbi:MAG: DoxX family protein [Chloroflexi bacterium]|nr:MAG: DoxX family protein [Chloroflexota bacterium]TMG08901.1 MAG: DoxX family protein [Chloroflexota bacterium]